MRPSIRVAVITAVILLPGGTGFSTAGMAFASTDRELAEEVTTVVQCFCGTCTHQTLKECTCGTAARERDKVAAAIAAGETPEQIIARYVQEHGPQVRIVPEKTGLDLVGFAVPFAASILALLALVFVLIAWKKRPAMQPATSTPLGPDSADAAYLDRLKRELEEYD